MTPSQPNGSLINGLACLQLVVTRDEPVGVRELARELKLTPTRVNRLLATLAHLGLVTQNARRKYRPGPAIHVLAAQSLHASPLLPLALPHLLGWRKEGFTVALGVLWRRQICYLFHERPEQNFEESFGRHEVYPAERSSAGMIMLAAADVPRPEMPLDIEYLGVSGTWNDILKAIRKRGYAVLKYAGSNEISIGVGIGSPPIAAMAISGQLRAGQIEKIAARLQMSAAEIATSLPAESR